MKNFIWAICAGAFVIASCDNKEDTGNDQNDAGQPVPAATAPATSADAPTFQNTPTPSFQQTPAQTTPSTAGLNPAHGQPGHRCDIPVGADLNSPPSAQQAPTQTTPVMSPPPPPVINPPAPVPPQPAATAPGMNPPHGQPGHDCSIAVGAPLKK